jgi:hypothetical protein
MRDEQTTLQDGRNIFNAATIHPSVHQHQHFRVCTSAGEVPVQVGEPMQFHRVVAASNNNSNSQR